MDATVPRCHAEEVGAEEAAGRGWQEGRERLLHNFVACQRGTSAAVPLPASLFTARFGNRVLAKVDCLGDHFPPLHHQWRFRGSPARAEPLLFSFTASLFSVPSNV